VKRIMTKRTGASLQLESITQDIYSLNEASLVNNCEIKLQTVFIKLKQIN